MNSNKCQRCGLVNFAEATECRRCNAPIAWGAEVAAAQADVSQQRDFNAGGGAAFNQQANYNPAYSAPAFGGPGQGYVSPYAQPAKPRTGQATASLVLGIFGIFSAGLLGIGSVIGLILGIRATLKAKREPSTYGAKGVAVGGIVTNSLGLLSIIPIAIFAAILIPNVMMIQMAANETNTIEFMRDIGNAESNYQSSLGRGLRFAGMQELIDAGLIPGDGARKYGYRFTIRLLDGPAPPGVDTKALSFEAVAVPENYGLSGKMSFYISADRVITYADRKGREATRDDERVDEYYRQLPRMSTRRRSGNGAEQREKRGPRDF